MCFVCGFLVFGEGIKIYLKAGVAQILLQNAWGKTQSGEMAVKPWPWADTYPVGRLEIPALDSDMIVLAGATGRTLAFGPAHLLSSAPPGGNDNMVIVGHRDTHFAFLQRVEINEIVFLETADGDRHRYRVAQIDVVHESATEVVQQDGVKRLTLITCYPFDAITPGGPLRYVVRAFGEFTEGDVPLPVAS